MSAFKILAAIFAGLAIFISGPIFGEQLQECRRHGVEYLVFPRRDIRAWAAYLDPKRYAPKGRWYIALLIVTQVAFPVFLLALFLSFV